MRGFFVILFSSFLLIGYLLAGNSNNNNHDDNEFAEFEDDFAEIVSDPIVTKQPVKEHEKAAAKDEKFADDDDFGVVDEEVEKDLGSDDAPPPPQPLKFADVPAHFRSNWASYQVEAIVLAIILIYVINYLIGRATNQSIANAAFENCREILEEQFAVVGDDGITELEQIAPILRRDTDYTFSAWCSGRINLHYFNLQMRMVKRQDLVSRVLDFFDPQTDRLTIKSHLESTNETDPLVLLVGDKKTTSKQFKEQLDLSTFTTERKQTAQQINLPANYNLYADQNEIVFSILEPGIIGLLKKHEKAIEFIHISDQFTGPKPPDGETYTRLPEAQRYLSISLNLREIQDQETMEELLNLVFYLIEKVKKFKLSREAKFKAEKRRKEFEEAFMRNTHQYRQEAAQQRKEEKTRERKQKLLDESDPDRQRRLEAKELKREAKAKQPKMKQLKMK
ncbi:unnamed protein product [Caenorhabditis angaria]|uniref:PAT complex subunit CCDC47 n=1 Tax=Caenorhabditis angaria TaxID=860376 RepID=A0A9P1IFL5_9PELO|nr:unnamed protein product [Caenorhabditis angaria]